MDRFSLLLLEPGEIYFDDFAVTIFKISPQQVPEVDNQPKRNQKPGEASGYYATNSPVRGRLKICSKSLVFVPGERDLVKPLLKFPLNESQQIEEWNPKSFQSELAKEKNLIWLQVSSYVEMMKRNILAPFNFVRQGATFVFSVKFGDKLDDHLSQICQLQRAATLNPVEQKGMIAAIVFSRQTRLTFDACYLGSVQETILLKTVGNKVTPLVVNPGRIVLTEFTLYFQPYNNAEKDPVIKVNLSSIKRIFQRRYLLRPLGLEIDYVDIKGRPTHIYLTFNQPEERQKLYHKLIQQERLKLEDIREDNMTLMWQNNLISNFDYLIYLNSSADRSFNDLTQYPVFPWVISDYTSQELDLNDSNSFRDLHEPMGALDKERLEALKERTQDMPEPRFLYGSHYSTPGFVLYFLVRKIPECMLCLQNGRFDHPDRMFNSIPQTWLNVTTHHSDFKELVPEFYMPENQGDFLENRYHIEFGTRHCGKQVSDVELPPWAESPKHFVETLREALETEYVSKNLHGWIDLIFGYKQRGKEAEKANNLFYYLCYEGSVDLESIYDLEERHALEVQIGEFGQVPKQIFKSPHPQRKTRKIPRSVSQISNSNIENPDEISEKFNSLNVSSSSLNLSNTRSESMINPIVENEVENVKMWPDMTWLNRVCDYQTHKESLSAVSISIDNLWVFSSSHGSILKMYSLEEMRILRSISVPNFNISCILPLPDNKTVLIGSKDQNICSYSIEFGRTSHFLDIHRDAISCMDWNADLLATGSWDSTVKIWRCSQVNGYKIRLSKDNLAILDHSNQVTCLNLCPDNSQLVTGTRDGNVVLWCLNTKHVIQELPNHKRQVNGVKFSPDASCVVSCGSDFFLKVIDLKTGTILFSRDLGEELNCISWDGHKALIGGGSGNLTLWDLHKGVGLLKFPAHKGPMTCLAVSNGGDLVVTGGEDRRIVVWTSKHRQL